MTRWAVLALLGLGVGPGWTAAQESASLRVVGPGGEGFVVDVFLHRGYAALQASALEPLGWSVEEAPSGAWELSHAGGSRLTLQEGSPFFRWDGRILQMTGEAYVLGGVLHSPVQLLTDLLPAGLPDAYAAEDGRVLRVKDPDHWTARAAPVPAAAAPSGSGTGAASGPASGLPLPESLRRVVVIDPGHGGRDPGAIGPGGTKEKDVALAMALALERELDRYPGLEVHLTRDSDVLVPLWKRGELATLTRGERPGIFISIHANALPERRTARGFETYFLSDARTEHERRVAANENAPLAIEGAPVPDGGHGELGFILKELRNFDHQHWSSLLAELVQGRLAPVHPGPNRGVKQGPFAVITNAFMPAVLVETGFITNREEERVLARADFQDDLARALAAAVVDFFQRYPPERGTYLEGAGPEGR